MGAAVLRSSCAPSGSKRDFYLGRNDYVSRILTFLLCFAYVLRKTLTLAAASQSNYNI